MPQGRLFAIPSLFKETQVHIGDDVKITKEYIESLRARHGDCGRKMRIELMNVLSLHLIDMHYRVYSGAIPLE